MAPTTTTQSGTGDISRWAGHTALVTGASSGIGAATALRLAHHGIKVVAAARRRNRLDALAAQHDLITPITVDLRDESSILAMFDAVRGPDGAGGVDLLINNAGLGRAAPLTSGDTEAWREMLEVNILALCVCTREAVSDMQRRDVAGHVVHIGSMAGHRVPGGSGVYSATKYAVRALTEGLRGELRQQGSDIRVTAISPGFVETEFAGIYHGRPDAAAETYGRYPVIQADEIADMVAYTLAAPAHVQIHDMLVRPTRQSS